MRATALASRERIKAAFPGASVYAADWVRYTFRTRQEFGPELRYSRAFRLAAPELDDEVLEVGHCSYQTIRMARRARRVTVCNLSGVNRAVAARGPRNLTQVKGDICNHPFADHSFDLAYCIAVLEHIPDDRAAAANLFRVLKPGGCLVVYVPDTDEHHAAWERGEYPDHVRPGYRSGQLRELLESVGFDVVRCELGNGAWAAVAGDVYYALSRWFPVLPRLPHLAVLPFIKAADLDARNPGSLRWGLFCLARRPADSVTAGNIDNTGSE